MPRDCKEKDMGAPAQNKAVAQRLWDVSVKMVKLDDSEIHPLLKQRVA
jgi:hypothetical protein